MLTPADHLRPEQLHIGVVSGVDGVHWIGAAGTPEDLTRDLAAFLLPRAPYQLNEADARRFRRLIAGGNEAGAVELYFDAADHRWERERLVLVAGTVPFGIPAPAEPAPTPSEHLRLGSNGGGMGAPPRAPSAR